MSTKRAAEQQLRRKLLPDQKKQKVANKDQKDKEEDEFIEFQPYYFLNSSQLCEDGMNQGFLITCKYAKEKSCIREFLKRIRSTEFFEFKSRIIKLALNGIVLILFEKLDCENLVKFYQEKIIQGEPFNFAQRITPIFKLVQADKIVIRENVQIATQQFVKLMNQLNTQNLNEIQKVSGEQKQNDIQTKNVGKKQSTDQEQQNISDQDQSQEVCQQHQDAQNSSENREQFDSTHIHTKKSTSEIQDSNNGINEQNDQKQKNGVEIQKNGTDETQQQQITTDQKYQQQEVNTIQQDSVDEQRQITYAVGVRTRGTKANKCPINRAELIDLGSQGFIQGCQETQNQSSVRVDLKAPQFVLMLECIPLASESLLGIGLLKGEWCITKPRLQPKILSLD